MSTSAAQILALINGYTDLKDYFETQRTDLQADIATAQNAYDALATNLKGVARGEMYKVVYVNKLTGDDANDGKQATPFATFEAAINSGARNSHLIIALAALQTHDMTVNAANDLRHLHLYNYGGAASDRATLKRQTGYCILNNTSFRSQGVDYDCTNGNGISLRYGGHVSVTQSDILIGGSHACFAGWVAAHVGMEATNITITEAAGATTPKLLEATTWSLALGAPYAMPASKTPGDYLNVVTGANGELLNGIINVAL